MKVNEDGDNKYKFPYAVVCGVSRPPRKVLTKMSEKTVKRRTSMKVFTKVMNLQHFMPTRWAISPLKFHFRYNVEFDFADLPKENAEPAEKKTCLKKIAKTFQESYVHLILIIHSYLNQNDIKKERAKAGVAYLFKKLHF